MELGRKGNQISHVNRGTNIDVCFTSIVDYLRISIVAQLLIFPVIYPVRNNGNAHETLEEFSASIERWDWWDD